MRKYSKIVCPVCGAEYLQSEIFVPDGIIGKPTDIVKNKKGKIKSVHGDTSSLEEEYICDFCESKFYVYARLTFKTSAEKVSTFNEEHTITINDKVELDEE